MLPSGDQDGSELSVVESETRVGAPADAPPVSEAIQTSRCRLFASSTTRVTV